MECSIYSALEHKEDRKNCNSKIKEGSILSKEQVCGRSCWYCGS